MHVPKFVLIDVHDDETAFLVLHSEEPRFVLDPEEREIEWWSEPPPDGDDDPFASPLIVEAREFYERALHRLGTTP